MSATDPNKYPIELSFPDISGYRKGNTGVEFYTSFDSGTAGPHVLINALVHGNEVCGVLALAQLFEAEIRPKRGKLTLGFSNVAAYQSFDPADPMASRFVDEDMNRVWDIETLEGERSSCEVDRARQIRPLIDTVDLMLDVHSMQHKTAPVIVAGPLDKSVALSRRLGTPEIIVADTGHAAGRRLRDYGGFGDPASEKTAVLIECGQHWEAGAAAVAIDSVYRWLVLHDMIDTDMAAPNLLARPEAQRVVKVETPVTVETEHFDFAQPFTGLETLAKGELIGTDGDREIRAPHDGCVLIMPSRRLTPGATAVRLGRWLV
ncbi:succinylglutamate desuccinylase/aspartoacylase family protein [Cognatishimia sp. F0-27]|uniref:succinylglutamate desuccinylase/aspartoacylase domain-containing protein n=1 Tax=Cognatishimia sp. F0-27 TaxID=2816855 RepID=UPI001D0CA738|nr:succinylglutamate desuccinylase/aspartoacylase family protein [Cognatishimia sp. F0-27]MCC1491856.1 succinylglutamate desuccinylase/aspartoacylase family protein [Cognatishimia sp. F0-27]